MSLLVTGGLFLLILGSGCTHPRVEAYLPRDGQLDCRQLQEEVDKAEEAIATIDKKTGVSWRNAGLILFSGVGLIMNEVNGSRERTAATARIQHLEAVRIQKNCR